MHSNVTLPDRLNLGCGPNAPANWVNVDGSWNAWLSSHLHLRRALESLALVEPNQGSRWDVRPLVHDLTKPLPFKDNTFAVVYGSHVLEHLYLVDAQKLLRECRRILRPGGVIRLVVPDLRSIVMNYVKNKNGDGSSPTERIAAADKLNEKLGFWSPAPPDGNVLFRFYSALKGFHHHRWMYDSDSLICQIQVAGFQEVSQKEYLKSDIPGLEEVEEPDRVLDGAGICAEGIKGKTW